MVETPPINPANGLALISLALKVEITGPNPNVGMKLINSPIVNPRAIR